MIIHSHLLHPSTKARLLKQSQSITAWRILKHTREQHDFRVTSTLLDTVLSAGQLLEWHNDAGTERLLFDYDGRHWVFDLDDKTLVTSYVPNNAKTILLSRKNTRGLFSKKQNGYFIKSSK